jgi:hypothetical protein
MRMFENLIFAADFPLSFASPIGAAAWAVLAGIPVGIIALYFLKLRRRPVQVPSTLLWRRSMEDLHVNSLFQRLRKNLLLFLQLAAVLLAMLALAGPRLKGTAGQGQKFVIAIDNSASMAATDVAPTRLGKAKADAKKIVDAMESDDVMMVISFSDRARVVSNYTGNRPLLRQRIDSIQQTEDTTSLREALVVAAGLANPASDRAARDLPQGVIATNVAAAPKLTIFTDGGFADVDGFSLGNIEPEVVVIGPQPPPFEPTPPDKKEAKKKDPSDNVAILALQAGRNEEKPDQFQVFGRVHNYKAEAVQTEAKLYRHHPSKRGQAPTLIDAVALKLDPQADQSFKFDLPETGSANLEVRIDVKDSLPLDDRAFTVFGNPRKAQILLVSAGDRYLADTLKTTTTQQLADVNVVTPAELKSDAVSRDLGAGRYDLVIFDGVRPETSPEANTLYFGALPPGKAYEKTKVLEAPTIAEWDNTHPLMQYIRDLGLVRISKATVVEPPTGATVLIESGQDALAFVAPREGYVDAVVTFGLVAGKNFNTDWPLRYSFPLFLHNSLRVLGNARDSAGNEVHLPDQQVVLRAESLTDKVDVTAPSGRSKALSRTPQGTFVYNDTSETGIYHAKWGKDGSLSFPVNLFDARESDIAPRGIVPDGASESQRDEFKIKIGYTPVKGTRRAVPAVKDWWKPITVAVLGLLLFEWYIYNRRVYV